MFDSEKSKFLEYVDNLLLNYPPVLSVSDLAELAGWRPQRVYALAVRSNKGELGLLPIALKIPNSNLLRFTKTAVRDWFIDAAVNPKKITKKKSPGRPRGSTSRRGIGRSSFESSI